MIRVNAYCKDWGWLFEDLKVSLAMVDEPGVEVIPSSDPHPNCDAYICIRTDEALSSPDPAHTVVQWHDYREHPATWSRLSEFGALQTVCPRQERPNVETHCCPVGARDFFRLRESLQRPFRLGWVGRDVRYRGRRIKRPQMFVDLIKSLRDDGMMVDAAFYGPADSLDKYAKKAKAWRWSGGRAQSLERFYHGLDALVVTCEPEPGPLSVYEALRCGVPVISTPTGATATHYPGIYERQPGELVAAAKSLWRLREQNFSARRGIRRASEHLTQEYWARFSVQLAAGLVR